MPETAFWGAIGIGFSKNLFAPKKLKSEKLRWAERGRGGEGRFFGKGSLKLIALATANRAGH